MGDEVHAERRDPEQPEGAFDLRPAGEELLEQARGLSAGRAARTLTPGAGAALKQTLLAITAGARMDEHVANGPATIQVLRGEVVVRAGGSELELREGQWGAVPVERHDLIASGDSVVLLTVASDT